jgi:hypothetical protein
MYARPLEQWSPLDHQFAYLARPQVEKKPTHELEFGGEMRERWTRLNQDLNEHAAERPAELAPVMSVSDVGTEAPATHVNNDPQRDQVQPGFLSVLDPDDAVIEKPDDQADSTGRRAALARWLTRPDHPLTPRVLVNRIWQQHLGRGIVVTANDFGRQGARPSHPELLDWLTECFIEDGWSLKRLHRRIVLSATYRQASRPHDAGPPADELFCGRLPRRLDAEPMRDGMLKISGELLPYQGEPSVDGDQCVPSIQVRNIRNRPDEWLHAFDGPDMFNSCARRYVTTTPLQSLLVVNSPWSLQRAEALAQQIEAAIQCDQGQWASAAFQRVLMREPTESEREFAAAIFTDSDPPNHEQLTDLCHVLFCSNEFIYVD